MDSERSVIYCSTCNAKYDVSGATPGKRFICKSCRTIIKIPPKTDAIPFFKRMEDAEVLRPELIVESGTGLIEESDLIDSFEFTKMVATENDYVLIDCFREDVPDPETVAKMVCHRRRGVGADGVLFFLPCTEADFRMRMYNPDGSEAEMCGNGIRCLARYAYDHEYTEKTEFTVLTKAGIRTLLVATADGKVQGISVNMGEVRVETAPPGKETLEANGHRFEGVAVNVGNPHFVIFTEDVDGIPLSEWGPVIENHPRFPDRTNVEFVQVISRGEVMQRTFERGAGETHGCGTGATAVCAAAQKLGLTDPKITLHLRGGDLEVEVLPDLTARLTGPAVEVFTGTWIPGGIKTGFLSS